MQTIKDVYKLINADSIHPIMSCLSKSLFRGSEWATEYNTHFSIYDPLFLSLFGDMAIDDIILDGEEIDTTLLDSYMTAELFSNKYTYDKMWNAMQLEYEPLWNVDGTEVITFSEKETTHDIGARTETTNIGARNEHTDNGARQTTTTHGQDTSTNQMSADNSTDFVNADKNIMTTGDTVTSDMPSTDTRVTNPATDTRANASAQDKDTEGMHTETHRRTGNIGLTTSMQLLREEYAVARVNFFKMVIRDAVNSIAIPFYL